MKKTFLLTAIAFALIATIPAQAQGNPGCSDSPENPTLILAGLAGGAYAISNIRMKIRARRGTKNR